MSFALGLRYTPYLKLGLRDYVGFEIGITELHDPPMRALNMSNISLTDISTSWFIMNNSEKPRINTNLTVYWGKFQLG